MNHGVPVVSRVSQYAISALNLLILMPLLQALPVALDQKIHGPSSIIAPCAEENPERSGTARVATGNTFCSLRRIDTAD